MSDEDLTKNMICENCNWFKPSLCGLHGDCNEVGIVENEAIGCELWTLP